MNLEMSALGLKPSDPNWWDNLKQGLESPENALIEARTPHLREARAAQRAVWERKLSPEFNLTGVVWEYAVPVVSIQAMEQGLSGPFNFSLSLAAAGKNPFDVESEIELIALVRKYEMVRALSPEENAVLRRSPSLILGRALFHSKVQFVTRIYLIDDETAVVQWALERQPFAV